MYSGYWVPCKDYWRELSPAGRLDYQRYGEKDTLKFKNYMFLILYRLLSMRANKDICFLMQQIT